MSEKFRPDRKIAFQNMFYTKCINVLIDNIGPLIILRSIYMKVAWVQLSILVFVLSIYFLSIFHMLNILRIKIIKR